MSQHVLRLGLLFWLVATFPCLLVAAALSAFDRLLGDGRTYASLWAAGPFLRACERWWGER